MININHAILLLFLHFIAEYLCQGESATTRKNIDLGWLILHAIVYAFIFLCGLAFASLFLRLPLGTVASITFIIFCTHIIVDFFTGRLIDFFEIRKENHMAFIVFGSQQFMHAMILLTTYYQLTR